MPKNYKPMSLWVFLALLFLVVGFCFAVNGFLIFSFWLLLFEIAMRPIFEYNRSLDGCDCTCNSEDDDEEPRG